MSDSSGELRQKIGIAAELHGVVRTMKAMAASSIGKYERAVRALAEYDRATTLGLAAALRAMEGQISAAPPLGSRKPAPSAIVIGSDQGLVGQFNDVIADYAIAALADMQVPSPVWAVGERVHARLAAAGLDMKGLLHVPNDVSGIAALVGDLLLQAEAPELHSERDSLYVFFNRPRIAAGYESTSVQLLPLDFSWRNVMIAHGWPNKITPELLTTPRGIFRALVREHLFISLYKACAESLASENASRLAAMQRADKNIDELTEDLTHRLHRVRQSSIDEELFDVVAGFEALS